MSNLNTLKKEIDELKAKRGKSNKKEGFDIFDKYRDDDLTFEEAMELLEEEEYVWGDVVRVLIHSAHYDDETKKRMLYG